MKIKKSKHISIKDIAKLANVSISTVSRAINKDPGASEKTIIKINKLAEELGYYPNSIAKSLQSKRSNTIGLIINDIQNPFFSDIVWTINEELYKADYKTIICYSNWDANRERENIIKLISSKVDGVIMTPFEENSKNIKLLIDNKIETVFVDSISKYSNISFSCCNHKKAVYLGITHLIKNGHKDILLFLPSPKTSFSYLFLEGYKQALSDYNIEFNKDLVLEFNILKREDYYIFFKDTFKKVKIKFTGIMIPSDFMAIYLYRALKDLDLKIPKDYSVVSYDNIDIIASILTPPLTTIEQPIKEIAYNAVRILLNKLTNENYKKVRRIITSPYLIERSSVKKL